MARRYTTLAEVKAAAGGASRFGTLTGISSDTDARLDQANAFAISLMESYVGKRYALPLDAPLPPVVHTAVVSFEVEFLTSTADSRPAFIKTNSDEAVAFLKEVAGGRAALADVDLATEGGTSTFENTYGTPTRIFDFDDPTSEGARRMKPI